uniref:Piezo type mechanosensitive ion channel component 1 (Er blood group) n=1 Tax=Chelonoidis abingdonii TaxID=106734 RepID=A0A8C0GCI8_CHEAB
SSLESCGPPPWGHTGRLLQALLGTSILFLTAHLVFQICLYTVPDLSQLLGQNCSTWETLARHIGVTRLDLNDIPNSVRLVAPDLGILLVSAVCLGLGRRLVDAVTQPGSRSLQEEEEEDLERPAGQGAAEEVGSAKRKGLLAATLRVRAHWLLLAVGKCLVILLLALAGIALPSAFSSVYYLLFVGICTWWACHFPISHVGFNTLCIMVGVFAAGHLLCIYSYQAPFIQGLFPPASIWARVFGLKAFILPLNCTNPHALLLDTSHPWPVYMNPGVLLLLYFTVASLLKLRKLDSSERAEASAVVASEPQDELVELESWPREGAHLAEDTEVRRVKPERRRQRLPLHALGHVIMNQSYVCALIAMMVWSITYHSWLTFVLLLWACLIWIVRSRHHFAMLCSPFLLLYGLALCSLQYVWGMDLEPELPTRVGFMSLEQLGLVRTKYPCLDLGAKLLYTLTFWLLLRQFVQEKLLKCRRPPAPLLEVTVSDAEPGRPRSVLKFLGELLTDLYAKYWIYVCAGMFIVVSFAGRLVVYKIVYMLLFLLCLIVFQVYYSLWRKLLKGFWWLVVAYTMLVLIAVYTFQFEDFPMYWRNLTGLTDQQLGDLGLEQFSVSELFSSILIPGFFLLACILQLHYFHRPFMRITDLEHVAPPETRSLPARGSHLLPHAEEEAEPGDSDSRDELLCFAVVPSKWGLVLERLVVLGWTFSDILTRGQVFVRRLLELHILKLVALYTVWVALQEVSVMNFLLVALWAFALPYCRFRHMASCLCTIWVCIIIVCKMLYQLKAVDPREYSSNCTQPQLNDTNLLGSEVKNSTLYQGPVDPANWFGIRKGFPNLGYIQNHLLVLMLLVFEAIVYRRQEYYRKQYQLVLPATQTLFEEASREHLDRSLVSCAKYFINYFYYKFGLEVCFLMTVNVIGQRMNFMVILHGCWLVVILTRRRRAAIARLWPKYCLFLALFLLYQYLLCVGIPPALCIDYPWRWSRSIPMNSALIKWMYLPDFYMAPNSTNLISDFLLLLCASQQWQVFAAERTEEWLRAAGENTDQLELARGRPNPVPNFINCRSYLDMLKVVVFRYYFWLVLVVVFITGATRISIFGLGYLLACFYLLLFGTAMLRKPVKARLMLWDCLILYNVTVIISKNMLSLLSCVFVQQMQSNFCWVIQLFSLVCTVKGYYDPKEMGKDQDCLLPMEEAGIIWDSICFFFLLLQRRVFLSYYFLHVMTELQASALQASRGFALYKARTLKSMRSHRHAEEKSLLLCVVSPRLPTVLHSGEYFLFESDSEEEEEASLEEQKPAKQSAFQVRAAPSWPCWSRAATSLGGGGPLLKLGAAVPESSCPLPLPLPAERSNMVQRALNMVRFLWVLCQAMVDGLTQWLHAFTKEHRDMSTVLWVERYVLTQKLCQGDEVHSGVLDDLYQPAPGDETAPQTQLVAEQAPYPIAGRTGRTKRIPWSRRQDQPTSGSVLRRQKYFQELEESEQFYQSQNRFLKLLLALYHFVAAHSELLCYFIIILNNMVSASIISLFLPILVFLWAMLSIPRPSKRFWMTAIVFTEVVVVVKYLFQFGFFPWNSYSSLVRNDAKPFFPPRILGLEKTDRYLKFDLVQLMALFFHRSLLLVRAGGCWGDVYSLWLSCHGATCLNSWEPGLQTHCPSVTACGITRRMPSPSGSARPSGGRRRSVRLRQQSRQRSCHPCWTGGMVQSSQQRMEQRQRWCPTGLSSSPTFRAQNMYQPLRGFFCAILHTKYQAATDVYALMFLADVVDFIIIIFGFWAFGKHSAAADITSSLSDDQVPEAFLVMLLIQFSTMVIDRALYLRKTVLGKLIFQVILVFGIHLWMFFILPAVTERMFSLNTVAQLWYFVKCIYFALSAYQIRCGYPTRILGNFLTKKYNHLNLFLFQGFRLVPFLVELRAVMDWVWTDTTLSLSNWMCVEDIYANIFIIKCSRETEKKYPQPKGQKKKKIVKYGMGGLIILFLICIIWFPLLFMSLVRSVVGVVNHPIDVTVTLQLGGYEPLFTMSAQQQSIQPFTPQDYEALTNQFERQPVAMQFITLYGYEDIVTARIEGSSGSLWSISPPSREQMRRELLNGSSDITLRLTWTFQRDLGKGGTVEHTFDKHTTDLQPGTSVRTELANLLQGTRDTPVKVPHLFPTYIRAPNGPEANPVKQLLPEEEESYLGVKVQLKRERVGTGGSNDSFLEWWVVQLSECQQQACNILPMVIFNDKVSPPSLGFLAGYGIMGLYVSIVLVIGKFVRGFFSEISHSIMFEELPCVDRILKLCQDIFLVRETGELELEEELYAKLIFLYRSPETMIKWTREKE